MITTAGSRVELETCTALGADVAINYRETDFVAAARRRPTASARRHPRHLGASYLGRNVDALAIEGRLVIIGMQGGTKGELDINLLLRKRGAVIATALRSRPTEEKAAICRASWSTSGRSSATGWSSRSSTPPCRSPRPPPPTR